MNMINVPTYDITKYLANLLKPMLGQTVHVKNSAALVMVLDNTAVSSGDLLVSLDVVSVLMKVPLEPNLKLLEPLLPTPMDALFEYVLCSIYFMYNGSFYDWVDGVAMGSPLSSVIADFFFMESFRKTALEMATLKLTLHKRYMDNTFLIWSHSKDTLTGFVSFLNNFHRNIQFTVEIEQEEDTNFAHVD